MQRWARVKKWAKIEFCQEQDCERTQACGWSDNNTWPSAEGVKKILLAKAEMLQVKCNQQSVSSCCGDAAQRETQTFSYIIPIGVFLSYL